EDGIRDRNVTGVQTCALPISERTQQLLTSLKNEGINVRGVTRLGYPVVIGAFPLEEKTVVDGIVYMRLLPTKYPILKSEQTDLRSEERRVGKECRSRVRRSQ